MTLSSTARQIIFWLLIVAGAVLLYRLVNPSGKNTQPIDLTSLYAKIEAGEIKPRQDVTLTINRADDSSEEVPLTLRIDTPIEVEYYKAGGILPFVLRQLING